MSARRVAFAPLSLCAAFALSACTPSTSASATPASAPPASSSASIAPTGSESPAPTGSERVAAREDTRRLHVDELRNTGGWALRSATTADGAPIAALFHEDAPEGVVPTLEFKLDDVTAHAGCNTISGTYRIRRDSITLNLLWITEKFCLPESLNRVDTVLKDALNGHFRAELLEGAPLRLRLTAEDGRVYMFEALPLRL